MSFEAAFVSLMWAKPAASAHEKDMAWPTVTVHAVALFDSEAFARDELSRIATSKLREQFGDKFVGECEGRDLAAKKLGDYAITADAGVITVWRIESVVIGGYLWNGSSIAPVKAGYFAIIKPVESVFDGAKKISALAEELVQVRGEAEEYKREAQTFRCAYRGENERYQRLLGECGELETMIDGLRKNCSSKTDECRKLLGELEKARKDADRDVSKMQEMAVEIADLRRRAGDKDKEIARLREDAAYAVRSGSTPTKMASQMVNPVYSEAVSLIKNFDRDNLLTKRDRDIILSQKRAKQS